jgi:hypothetical protein
VKYVESFANQGANFALLVHRSRAAQPDIENRSDSHVFGFALVPTVGDTVNELKDWKLPKFGDSSEDQSPLYGSKVLVRIQSVL